MNQLKKIYQKIPNKAQVSLELLNINDLTKYIPELAKFKHMDTLSLHGNNLKTLPSLARLQSLRVLDVFNNPLKIDERLLDNLFACPNLVKLTIDVTKSQKKMIIDHLPKLQVLNGEPISRKLLEKDFTETDLYKAQQKLRHESSKVKEILSKLQSILSEGELSSNNRSRVFLQQEFIEMSTDIFSEFDYFYSNIHSELSQNCVFMYYKAKMYDSINKHITDYFEDNGYEGIADALKLVNSSNKENFQDLLRVALSYSYENEFNEATVKQGNKLRKETLYHHEITRLKKQVANLTRENKQLERANSKYVEKLCVSNRGINKGMSPKAKVARPNNELPRTPLKETTDYCNVRVFTPSNTLSKFPSRTGFNQVPSNAALNRSPSKKTLSRNVSHQGLLKSSSARQIGGSRPVSHQKAHHLLSVEDMQRQKNIRYEVNKRRPVSNRFEKVGSYENLNSQSHNGRGLKRTNTSYRQLVKKQSQGDQYYNSDEAMESAKGRKNVYSTDRYKREKKHASKVFTFDQLKSTIEDFITQKVKFNLLCIEKKDSIQTPQQFLFTYFSRKYGLKELALEWSLVTIKAVEKFSKEDVLIEIFGKILKNELDEQFYSRAKIFKEIVQYDCPRSKEMSVEQCQKLYNSYFSQNQDCEFQEWIATLSPIQDNGQSQRTDYQSNQESDNRYLKSDIIYALQSQNLRAHEKEIQKFLWVFSQNDSDDDGILENQEISQCIQTFFKENEELFELSALQRMGRKGRQIINKRKKQNRMKNMTFSEFVALMRDYL